MTAQALGDPFRPQPASGLRAGGLMSIGVHLGLVAVLAALVWRSAPPQAVVAELWSTTVQQAAPAAVETETLPPSPPEPPAPTPRETAPPPPPQKAAAVQEADIALQKARDAERERREKAEQEKLRREKLERERLEREKAERLKAEQDKAKREKAERERREKAERAEKAAKAERLERERVERERAERAAEARAEKLRKENLARLQGLAGATGAPEASGTAAQSSGPSAGYAGRIRARIKPLIVYPDAATGNPVAEVEVRLSPTGTIIGSRLLKRSGTPEWDAAVLRAVEKAEVLPRDVDGRVPPVIVLVFSPRE